MFEALILEITIAADDTVRPVFKLPLAGDDEGLALNGPAPTAVESANQTVRALPTMVGDSGFEPVTPSCHRTVRTAPNMLLVDGTRARRAS